MSDLFSEELEAIGLRLARIAAVDNLGEIARRAKKKRSKPGDGVAAIRLLLKHWPGLAREIWWLAGRQGGRFRLALLERPREDIVIDRPRARPVRDRARDVYDELIWHAVTKRDGPRRRGQAIDEVAKLGRAEMGFDVYGRDAVEKAFYRHEARRERGEMTIADVIGRPMKPPTQNDGN